MNSFKFIIRSIAHFKKQHIGVFLATLLSSAVLTGALIISDSVKHSLLHLVELRLGNVENVLITGDRFVSNQLSQNIAHDLNIKTASVLRLESIAVVPENRKRISNVQLLGVDSNFWDVSDIEIPQLSKKEVIISKNLATRLSLNVGDNFLIRVRNADIIPISAPFSTDEAQSVAVRVKVVHIANDYQLGRFSLRNNQKAPYNIFIDRDFISQKVDLPSRSNLILAELNSNVSTLELNESLSDNFTPADAEIRLTEIENSSAIDVRSNRVFIDKPISDKIIESTIPHQRILTYFVNSIKYNNCETPYSFISAVDDDYYKIKDSEIIVNSWLASDLNANIGDSVDIKYYVTGPMKLLEERSNKFIIKDIIPIESNPMNQALMPDFPGLANAESCGDWDAGIPINLDEIRSKDEEYWNDYKGTPKAYISLDKGIELWKNQFGDFTTIRFDSNNINKSELSSKIEALLEPAELGLNFVNIRLAGTIAASNGVDFGELFLSLGFFIIVSALMLTVLIYSLNLSSRMYEVGILSSLGLTLKHIIQLRIAESLPIIIVASIIGGLCGILYNNAIITALNSIWNDAIHADLIKVKIVPNTIIIGIIISVITSLLSIFMTTVRMLKKNTVKLVKQDTTPRYNKKHTTSKILAIIGLTSAISIAFLSLSNIVTISPIFVLSASFLFILGSVSVISLILNWKLLNSEIGIRNALQIALKNTRRNKGRSISVISLLAIGTATIVLTGSNRLTFHNAENQRQSGTGGYTYWVENTIPIVHNLNSKVVRSTSGLDGDYMDRASFIQLYNTTGDDASCLNLNQVSNPQILGVRPQLFDSLNSFSFSKTINNTKNPWLELTKYYGENTIPAIADQTVIQWGLMKSIGDTLYYINEYGDSLNLILVGGLAPSIFQGSILIADSLFLSNFPSSAGSNIMLVEASAETAPKIKKNLENYYSDYGIDITLASQRLMDFYSVTNTYLTIFMILGGLGILIGTIGLGIVITRNMLDRKYEINIYYALGFSRALIFRILFIENFILLLFGVLIGLSASIIGIIPSITSPSYNIPGNYIFVILSIIIINGLIWIVLPTTLMLKNNTSFNLREDQ